MEARAKQSGLSRRAGILITISALVLSVSAWQVYAWVSSRAQEDANDRAAAERMEELRNQMQAPAPEPTAPQAPPEGVTNHGPMAIPGR